MKKYIYILLFLLIFPVSGWGTIYYVDADCATPGTGTDTTCDAGGDDGPFQTIAQAQVVVTGDESDNSLLFKKGNIWREKYEVAAYGTEDHPFTIGAYGEGDNPIISGASDISTAGWADQTGNVWRYEIGATAQIGRASCRERVLS